MSATATEFRLPLADADRLADWLMDRLWPDDREGVMVVGSVRRRKETVGDLEFVAPKPAKGEPDPLLERIQAYFPPEGRAVRPGKTACLFDEPPAVPAAKPLGVLLMGGGECFGLARLRLNLVKSGQAFQVEIYRYVPGPMGNRGWITAIRTGPGEFGRMLMRRWTVMRAPHGADANWSTSASEDGFPLDHNGARMPCPTEELVFQMCRWPWVRPEMRDDFTRRNAR